MINRGVLIVRPKQPFLDWAAGLDESGLLPNVEGEQTVYLIPDSDTPDDTESVIEQVYLEVFENELWGWHTDEAAWPANRDLVTFREWFALELHSVVEDLCDHELIDDDDDNDD
jgi:hypothetical protein